jgi:hypothetical protein
VLVRAIVTAATRSPAICRGRERGSLGSLRRRSVGGASILALCHGWGTGARGKWIGDPAPGFPSHRGGEAERLAPRGPTGVSSLRVERAARPRPQPCSLLLGASSQDSSSVGSAEVETSLKWLCIGKVQFQPPTPPLVF